MSTTTTKLGLIKPELTDAADITAMNQNWDILDTTVVSKFVVTSENPTSADTLMDNGFYRCYFDGSSVTPEQYNFPCKYGSLWTFGSSSYKAQLCLDVLNNSYYFRTTSNASTWKPWKRVITESEPGVKGQVLGFTNDNEIGNMTITPTGIGALPNVSSTYAGNLNELTDGLHPIVASATNTPISSTAGICIHKTWDTNFAIQLFFPSQNKVYRRTKLDGSWNDWVLLYDELTMPSAKDFMFRGIIKADNLKASESLKDVGTYQIYLENIDPTTYNYPNKYGMLTVERGTSYFKQTFYDMVGKVIYYRSSVDTGTTWTEWRMIYDSANKPSASDIGAGTFAGRVVAQNNTNYTTKQVRNIFLVAEGETLPSGSNGDICLVYTP